MEIRKWITILIGVAILTGCILIEYEASPLDPRLPIFSSKGSNAAGAYVDGYSWIVKWVKYEGVDFKVCTDEDEMGTWIILADGYQVLENHSRVVDVGFFLGDMKLGNLYDLTTLQGAEIQLDGITNYGTVIFHNDQIDTLRYGVGKLFIHKVEINDNNDAAIFSGTFGFDINFEGLNHTVYSGRFDYWVDNTNFWCRF